MNSIAILYLNIPLQVWHGNTTIVTNANFRLEIDFFDFSNGYNGLYQLARTTTLNLVINF